MRRVLRWVGWGTLALLVLVMILPYVLSFESSGTLTVEQAAHRSLGAPPTFLELEGIDVYVEREVFRGGTQEAGQEPLIVVLHGFGASTATWREMLPDLATLGEVVAYDRPPFGFTERPTGDAEVDPYGIMGQVELLGAVIDATRGDNPDREVVLLGHSAGGTLAAEFARHRPGQADALVLVAPAVLTSGGTPGWLRPVLGFPPIDRAGPWLARSVARSADGLLERSWHDPTRLTDAQRDRYDEPQQVDGWEQGLWRLVRAPSGLEVSEDPGALELPVLLVTGDDDRVVPTDDTVRLADLIDGAELSVLDRTGHVPHEESPEAFLDAVVAGWPLAAPSAGDGRD